MRNLTLLVILLTMGMVGAYAIGDDDLSDKEAEALEHKKEALETAEWLDAVKADVAEWTTEAKDASTEVGSAAGKVVSLKKELVGKLEAKLAAHRAEDWDKADAVWNEIEDLEHRIALAELDLEAAYAVADFEDMTESLDVAEADGLIQEIKDLYARRRAVWQQLYALQKQDTELERQITLAGKRLQIKLLEAEIAVSDL